LRLEFVGNPNDAADCFRLPQARRGLHSPAEERHRLRHHAAPHEVGRCVGSNLRCCAQLLLAVFGSRPARIRQTA
jgi:hypothetical protein